ncbi:hypothetical protein [Paenibacillus wynnii]|uniref:hypothetical protein n=1 Tax=Paenibacillus wynnii TaxID=268407 RepID=UPI002792720D|nr:hypothetical protein [Paenibacillus wynnii]MDQ0192158.1 Tfp pilus assembly protein PilX [Paenibacillus wynnii]
MSVSSQRHIIRNRLGAVSRRFTEERGSALVLVMFIVLLLTILGLSVLSAAVGGAQRTETRKNDVQSLHLAEKTLDEAVAYITASLNKKIDEKVDFSQTDLDDEIANFLQSLQDESNGLLVSTDLLQTDGAAAVGKIINVDSVRTGSSQAGQSVSYRVTLTAEAEVNGVTRTLSQTVVIDTFPDFLKYTLGSESNLTINGAPYIQGNIYAGDTLTISDTARYTYKTIDHTFLSKPFELLGEAHVQSLNKLVYQEQGKQPLTADKLTSTTLMAGKILPENVKIKSHRSFVEVNVESSFIDKVAEAVGGGANRKQISDSLKSGSLASYLIGNYPSIFDHSTLPSKPDPGDTSEHGQELQNEYNAAVLLLTQPSKSVIYEGDLTLDGTELRGITYTQSAKNSTSPRNWYIIDGDLIINNYGNATPIQVRANILVTGKVEIRGKVEFDSTIFALRSSSAHSTEDYTTIVEDASIQGMNGKELVLISQGRILINRLAAFNNFTNDDVSAPLPLDAFFYTDSDAKLYGVGSIFSLSGGFFAKGDLTINAVRGSSVEGAGDITITPDNNIIRFRASYNDQIFNDQKAGLPRVRTVNIRVENLKLN